MSSFDDWRNKVEGTAIEPQGADTLRQEYLSRQQQHADMPLRAGQMPQPGSDRTTLPNSVFSQNFDNPVAHLDRARWYLQNEGRNSRNAISEYYAAIRAADLIDPREVAQARKQAQEALKTETDPLKRRQLVQWDATLHDMERAKGFTRANLGMFYIRMGYQGDGIQLIVEAGYKDPEMRTDPNFIRHMRELNTQVPFDGRIAVQPTNRPPGIAPDDGGVRSPQDRRTGVLPAAGDRVEGSFRPPENLDTFRRSMENQLYRLARANGNFEMGMQLTPAIKAEFEAAIQAADKLDRGDITARAKAADDESKKYFHEEAENKIKKLMGEYDELDKKLAQEHHDSKAQLEALDKKYQAAKNDAERQQIVADMRRVPFAEPLINKQDELSAAETAAGPDHKKFVELKTTVAIMSSLNDSSRQSRFAYAFALNYSSKQKEAVLAGNLTEMQRVVLANLSEEPKLTDAQKTFLKTVAETPTLTDEQRNQLKQLSGAGELNERQKSDLKKITEQFTTVKNEAVRSQIQTLIRSEKARCLELLGQLYELDPNASKDRNFVRLAQEAGFKIPESQSNNGTDRTSDGDQAQAYGRIVSSGDPLELLDDAKKKAKANDFAGAKAAFTQAIDAAGKLNQDDIKKEFDFWKAAATDTNVNQQTRENAIAQAFIYQGLQHSPYLSRFEYAIFLHNAALDKTAGADSAEAKRILAEAVAKDPEAAGIKREDLAKNANCQGNSVYNYVKEQIEKGQKITEDGLKEAQASAMLSPDELKLDTSLKQFKAANDRQNFIDAAEALKSAIAAADKLDMTPYKKVLEEKQAKWDALKTPMERANNGALELEIKQLKGTIDKPVELRIALAQLYLNEKVKKPELAKEILLDEKYWKDHQDATKRPDFKIAKAMSIELSKDWSEKVKDKLAKEWKGLTSDFGAMTVASIVYAMNPEAALGKRLFASIVAGAVAKPGLKYVLGETPTWGDAAWGGGMALMAIAGGEAHSKLAGRFANKIEIDLLKKQCLSLARTDGEKLALEGAFSKLASQHEMRSVEAIGRLMKQQFGDRLKVTMAGGNQVKLVEALTAQAQKLGVSQSAVETALSGKTGCQAIDAWVKLLENHSVTGLDGKVLLKEAGALGIDQAALKNLAAKQEANRIDVLAEALRDVLKDKADGKKLGNMMGLADAEMAEITGKNGKEAVDTLAAILKRRSDAGTLDMGHFVDKAAQLGIDKFQMTKQLALQDRLSIDALGDVLKKDLSKVNPGALEKTAKALGVTSAEELKKLEGKTGAQAVDAFVSIVKNRADRGLPMTQLNELAASMGISQSALREIAFKNKSEAVGTVQQILKKQIESQRELANEAYRVANNYNLYGIKEGDPAKLAFHLRNLQVGSEEQMRALLAKPQGAEASKYAVQLLKEAIINKEGKVAEALAAELKDKSFVRRFLQMPGGAGAEVAGSYAANKGELQALRSQIEAGRIQRFGSWAKSWLPWVKGEEGSIYREYKTLVGNANALEGRGWGANYLYEGTWGMLRNPLGRDVNTFTSLKNLNARSFFNRYRMDFATIGLMSAMYRGSHNGINVFIPDEQGKTMSVGDALYNTATGSATDAATGALVLPFVRDIAGIFRSGGNMAEAVSAKTNPWYEVRSGLWSRTAGRAWDTGMYGLGQTPGFINRKVAERTGLWMSEVPSYLSGKATISPEFAANHPWLSTPYVRLPMGLSTVGTQASMFFPRLQEAQGLYSTYSETQAIIDGEQAPIRNLNKPVDELEDEQPNEADPYNKRMMEILQRLQSEDPDLRPKNDESQGDAPDSPPQPEDQAQPQSKPQSSPTTQPVRPTDRRNDAPASGGAPD